MVPFSVGVQGALISRRSGQREPSGGRPLVRGTPVGFVGLDPSSAGDTTVLPTRLAPPPTSPKPKRAGMRPALSAVAEPSSAFQDSDLHPCSRSLGVMSIST